MVLVQWRYCCGLNNNQFNSWLSHSLFCLLIIIFDVTQGGKMIMSQVFNWTQLKGKKTNKIRLFLLKFLTLVNQLFNSTEPFNFYLNTSRLSWESFVSFLLQLIIWMILIILMNILELHEKIDQGERQMVIH